MDQVSTARADPVLRQDADCVARARALGPAIAAAADEIERTQAIPEPLLTQLHDARMARMLLPVSCGGDQVEPWVYMAAIEELSRHDGSVGWNFFVANSAALIAPFIPLATAREIYADPRSLIAWGPPNACKARAVPGGYRVSGTWGFASGSRQANWMGAHCQVLEPDGSLRLNRFGRPTIRTLLFRKENVTPIHDWTTIGMRGTASESYSVNDLFVPESFTGTREDPSLRTEPGPLYAFTMQGLYAVGVAGVGFGLARAMLDSFTALAADKTPRGLQRLADNAVVQASLARREAALGAARAYLTGILRDIHASADEWAPIGLQARMRVRLGCAHAIHTATDVVDWVYKAAGTSAIFLGTPFERRFRDMHTLSQQIQSRESHFEAVGRAMFNGDPDGLFL
ncbi:acyl-CoA dehydrogenase family protein [Rhodopila sp.]|jgi:alkylation response protein AidB-like acyl-CoA dehydrogenase|uniref:acyl-CoA dehydrogenase family protein n=1 Tax=Rhodopila sp. TaxID=2480087 RepID=UPI002C5FC4C7|nr:acyl-CoA dehydrogenase family protein [Rhodopila sp.]HVZ10621.1 acyl-CoA dehydrogenase family protein [Rhodopila sp.]